MPFRKQADHSAPKLGTNVYLDAIATFGQRVSLPLSGWGHRDPWRIFLELFLRHIRRHLERRGRWP